MTKSKRHRDNYTSDWDAFTLEQDSPPEVSNNEWDQIFSERVFRPETKPDVKVKIFNAIHGFIRLNTGYNNPGEYRERLKHLRKQVLLASDLAYNMEKYKKKIPYSI